MEIIKTEGKARRGVFETPHGTVQTPAFMNVATSAAIKGGISAHDLKNDLRCQVMLCNTYHLHVRPGDELVKKMGGLSAMAERNYAKAKLLYDYLDASALFNATVMGEDRSIMNVPFVTGNPDLDAAFVKQATAAGLVNLKGHRSVGGMRASIYNAMDIDGVQKLVDFMKDFEKANK